MAAVEMSERLRAARTVSRALAQQPRSRRDSHHKTMHLRRTGSPETRRWCAAVSGALSSLRRTISGRVKLAGSGVLVRQMRSSDL